jgi:hypothetical protein
MSAVRPMPSPSAPAARTVMPSGLGAALNARGVGVDRGGQKPSQNAGMQCAFDGQGVLGEDRHQAVHHQLDGGGQHRVDLLGERVVERLDDLDAGVAHPTREAALHRRGAVGALGQGIVVDELEVQPSDLKGQNVDVHLEARVGPHRQLEVDGEVAFEQRRLGRAGVEAVAQPASDVAAHRDPHHPIVEPQPGIAHRHADPCGIIEEFEIEIDRAQIEGHHHIAHPHPQAPAHLAEVEGGQGQTHPAVGAHVEEQAHQQLLLLDEEVGARRGDGDVGAPGHGVLGRGLKRRPGRAATQAQGEVVATSTQAEPGGRDEGKGRSAHADRLPHGGQDPLLALAFGKPLAVARSTPRAPFRLP